MHQRHLCVLPAWVPEAMTRYSVVLEVRVAQSMLDITFNYALLWFTSLMPLHQLLVNPQFHERKIIFTEMVVEWL